VVIEFDGSMTAKKLKDEIEARDGTAVADGLRLFFCGRELIDALELNKQAGKPGPGAVITAQMVIPTTTSCLSRPMMALNSNLVNVAAGGHPRPARFVGLRNQGATCYLNSLVQCLYMTPELRRGLLAGSSEQMPIGVSSALSSLFSALSSSSSAVSTEALTKALTSALVGGSSTRQEDVHEFWQVLTDKVETELRNTPQAKLLPNLFNGEQRFYVRCGECGKVSHTDDTFQDLKLAVTPESQTSTWSSTSVRTLNEASPIQNATAHEPVTGAHSEVRRALEELLKPEQLNGANQYFCDRCACKVDAERGVALRRLPRVLALQLKRFRYDFRLGQRVKLNDKFRFPTTIDMADFVRPLPEEEYVAAHSNDAGTGPGEEGVVTSTLDTHSRDLIAFDGNSGVEDMDIVEPTVTEEALHVADSNAVKTSGPRRSDNASMPYELYAVLVHSGSASFGHYYALIKDLDGRKVSSVANGYEDTVEGRGEWHEFNDQLVRPIKESDLAKVYGGGNGGTSSAYMLLYRAVQPSGSRDDAQRVDDVAQTTRANEQTPHEGLHTAGVVVQPLCSSTSLSDGSSHHEPKRMCLPQLTLGSAAFSLSVATDEDDDASENPYSKMGF